MRSYYEERDLKYWKDLESLISDYGLSVQDLLTQYTAFIRRRELPRLLADYEIFKLIKDVPGSIAELGCYMGAGLFTWGKLLETFVPGNRSRKVYGFESGMGYGELTENDGNANPWIDNIIGQKQMDIDFLLKLVELHNSDNLLPGLERVRVITGDILRTVPDFASNSQGTRLSLIYFDVNMYEPTIVSLRHLYPLLVPGGIVAFNGYGAPPWQGEALAFEEYFDEIGAAKPELKNFEFSDHPSAYFRKV